MAVPKIKIAKEEYSAIEINGVIMVSIDEFISKWGLDRSNIIVELKQADSFKKWQSKGQLSCLENSDSYYLGLTAFRKLLKTLYLRILDFDDDYLLKKDDAYLYHLHLAEVNPFK